MIHYPLINQALETLGAACDELPDGWEIEIVCRQGEQTIRLYDADGIPWDVIEGEGEPTIAAMVRWAKQQ